jgi:hypothetical protein
MNRNRCRQHRFISAGRTALVVVALALAAAPAAAQSTVQVSMPVLVSFQVANVGGNSTNPSTPVTFTNAALPVGQAVRISVKAETDLQYQSDATIPASRVTWTAAGVSSGIGLNGALSTTAYTTVFQGQPGATSGGLTLQWTLSDLGTVQRAATFETTLRWKVEAVTP